MRAPTADEPEAFIDLRLYVANSSVRSRNAISAAGRICRERLAGRCRLEVVDIRKSPARAVEDQVVAVPALVRELPEPRRVLIGDLQDVEHAIALLGL